MELIGLFIRETDESVPLKEISVRAFLQGYVVGFRSSFTYKNDSSDPLEVFFRTPVDDSYAVVDLEAIIDGKKIRAKIHEKEKAKELYQEAIASGRTAAFGEEKKGDIFSIVLGNLPPGKKAEIHLTMVGELDVEPDGSVRFVLPTVLKPRYTPAGSSDPLEPIPGREENPVKHAKGPVSYKFELIISGADGIDEVTSPSHQIRTQLSGQVINIGLDLEEERQKDVVILVRPKEPHKPLVIVEPGLSDGENDFQKSTAVMVSFFPEFKGDSLCTQAACEFVFVVDRSGSMRGQYISDAAQTLLLFLKSIQEGCFFNIIGFGSSYEKLFPESIPYNQENLEIAVKHVEGLQADLGGTEIFDPLKDIFSAAQIKGLPRQVFVLTDGSVSNTESVIKLVSKNSHKARCFSFGIGSGASTELVKGIAKAGQGAAEFITSGERLQPKVIRSLKKAMQPAVTSAEVKFSLPKGFGIQAAPENVPPMFIGERTIVYGILTPPPNTISASSTEGSISLTGDLLGAKIKHKVNFKTPVPVSKDHHTVTTIRYLAAKRLIKEMEVKNIGRDNEEIIKLSCDSNVVSSLTAFIAIDEDQNEPVKGSLQIWDIQAPNAELWTVGAVMPMSSRIYLTGGVGGIGGGGIGGGMLGCAPSGGGGPVCGGGGWPVCGGGGYSAVSAPNVQSLSSLKSRSKGSAKKSHSKRVGRTGQRIVTTSFSNSTQLTLLKGNLPTIVGLQMASGSWRLTTELAGVVGKTVDNMKQGCPVPCDGEMETIWATVIALSYLRQEQACLKEEWELVAAKAETWLRKQSFPEGCVLPHLFEKAIVLLK